MKLSEKNERILAEIDTYNPGLSNALSKACNTADAEGANEQEVKLQDAKYKAMDARVQAQVRGTASVKRQEPMTDKEALLATGIREHERDSLLSDFNENAVSEELHILAREIKAGSTSVKNPYGALRYRLSKNPNSAIGA